MNLSIKILSFFILISTLIFGQNRELAIEDNNNNNNNSTAVKITFVNPETCEEIEEWIKSDFEKKMVFLFLQGGVAPVQYTTDKKIEKKYEIYFHDFGCIAPEYKCVIKYNNRIFDYLTEKYGKKWMKEIRKDVIGFKEWKRKNKRKK